MAFAGIPRSDGHAYESPMGPLYRNRRILIDLHLRSYRSVPMARKSKFPTADAGSSHALPSHVLT